MARSNSKNSGQIAPKIRMPYERHRQTITFDPELGRTHQSFRDECDIDRIIDLHTRTGIVNHLNPGQPLYGDAPDSDLFRAAVAHAEVRSAIEDGWEPPEAPEEPVTGSDPPPDENPLQAPEEPPEPPETPAEG